MRFEKKDDHYLDTKTGLQWSLDNIGPMTWDKATWWYPSDNGWRVPTIVELLTLMDYERIDPATELPDMRPFDYWSSTTYAGYPYHAWSGHFGYGSNNWHYKSYSYYVRAVRGEMK